MASGGHFGGGFHSGGFHSGGFGGGGGFSGGGFSGGGFSGGGGSHFHGGGYYRSDDDDPYEPYVLLIVVGGAIICFIIGQLVLGNIPGLNLLNTGIFITAAGLFIPSHKQSDRTDALKDILKHQYSKSYIKSEVYSGDRIGSKLTWAGKNNKSYWITFYEKPYGENNVREVYETMKRTPRIVWVRPKTWSGICIALFVINFFFYEVTIPFFENMWMSDEAFVFFDYLIFYLPSILALLCPILSLIFVKVRDNILYECALRIAEDIAAKEKRKVTESEIDSKLSKKWYYKVCPNCGAPATGALKHCLSCGSSLEVLESTQIVGAMRRIYEGDSDEASTAYLDRRIKEV